MNITSQIQGNLNGIESMFWIVGFIILIGIIFGIIYVIYKLMEN